MTLADLMPIRIGILDRPARKPRHRASDEVERLQFLLAGARQLIKGLHLQLEDKDREHEQVIQRIDERHAETVRGLERQIAELQRRLDIGVLAQAAADETQEIPILTAVMPLPEAAAAGLLGPVTDPGHTTPR